jgi:hypothetical protein
MREPTFANKIEMKTIFYFIAQNKIKMDKRINKVIEDYVVKFKDNIRTKINELGFEEQSKINDLLEYVYEYTRLEICRDDMVKTKRTKDSVPGGLNRCNAKRCSGEQCTRRRKKDSVFCGTHSKGTPHGVAINTVDENASQRIELVAKEIGGIVYYLDNFGNVYNTEDILDEKQNPRIIAKYQLANGHYSIPEFGIC